jgi:hypothetical protein
MRHPIGRRVQVGVRTTPALPALQISISGSQIDPKATSGRGGRYNSRNRFNGGSEAIRSPISGPIMDGT